MYLLLVGRAVSFRKSEECFLSSPRVMNKLHLYGTSACIRKRQHDGQNGSCQQQLEALRLGWSWADRSRGPSLMVRHWQGFLPPSCSVARAEGLLGFAGCREETFPLCPPESRKVELSPNTLKRDTLSLSPTIEGGRAYLSLGTCGSPKL